MDEAPELAVKGYMGVGRLTTLSKQLLLQQQQQQHGSADDSNHNELIDATNDTHKGYTDGYKSMVTEGHAIAGEYDHALGSARKDADMYERAVNAHDMELSSEQLLDYRVRTFRYI